MALWSSAVWPLWRGRPRLARAVRDADVPFSRPHRSAQIAIPVPAASGGALWTRSFDSNSSLYRHDTQPRVPASSDVQYVSLQASSSATHARMALVPPRQSAPPVDVAAVSPPNIVSWLTSKRPGTSRGRPSSPSLPVSIRPRCSRHHLVPPRYATRRHTRTHITFHEFGSLTSGTVYQHRVLSTAERRRTRKGGWCYPVACPTRVRLLFPGQCVPSSRKLSNSPCGHHARPKGMRGAARYR